MIGHELGKRDYELTPDLPDGFQMTELGPLPKEWRVVRLGEVAEKPQYGFTAAAQRDPVGPKMLRITDIQDGNVNWNAVPYCECGIEDIPKYLLEAGDILFASGWQGLLSIVCAGT